MLGKRSWVERKKEGEQKEKSESGGERISFFDWLRRLSLPIVLIIVAILNGVYALEINSESVPNFQPIYKGTEPTFVK